MDEGGPFRLRDGRPARVRRATPEDAEAILAHVNRIGAEGIYLMTERLARTVAEEQEVLRRSPGEGRLDLVATVGAELVGTADAVRGEHRKNAHTARLGVAVRQEFRASGSVGR
jgi:hypothetical protein